MAGKDLVRPSRDGDQFHYQWAARHCLKLLPGENDLVAVTIEGPSIDETDKNDIKAGEELIDVALYYGTERRGSARLVRYIQLKHSTRHALEPWTASGLEKTIKGFAERYSKLVELFHRDDIAQRFRFEFTTNRPISSNLKESLDDFKSGGARRHPKLAETLIGHTGLEEEKAERFFGLFFASGGERDLWEQRNLLTQDITAYLPDADYDTPTQLKELVTRKATTEFESNPSIHRHDVLRALRVSESDLQPAPCLIQAPTPSLPREQEQEILQNLLNVEGPLVIHADGGEGKSILAARLASVIPSGSVAVLYDCFGDGLYRNALHSRHRHRDALVQIANELAAKGLCHPLLPTVHADPKQYMRAFCHRITQAMRLLRVKNPETRLCLIIDAADNAEMAAEEQREPASFVRDLIRVQLPKGVQLAFTCRTHRRQRLGAPPGALEIKLRPFSEAETALHLRSVYPSASDSEVSEFAFLSSSNPRVQALALARGLPLHEMLKQLGPEPTTVDDAIGDLLEAAVAQLRDEAGSAEYGQIEVICQGLATLRPLVPISVLAQLSQVTESAIRSFVLDLGRYSRALLLKGHSLHFLDEPSESWFRDRFQLDSNGLAKFIKRLEPLAGSSSYVAAALPQLLLQAGKLDELVELAVSGEGLPEASPLERRNVELQRLTFALKACLQHRRHLAAAKLAIKAGAECAGEERQNKLIQDNTDLAAALMASDRIEEIVSRRTFNSGWMGSHHAYDAGLLSGREEFTAEASSRLRMAMDWLHTWAELPEKERRQEEVSDGDRVELAMALLRLRGPEAAARFLRAWTRRPLAFQAGSRLAVRLIDLGQYHHLDALFEAAGNDLWLMLGLAAEARVIGYLLPAAPLKRMLRLLAYRRVDLSEYQRSHEKWNLLHAICSTVELAIHLLPPEHSMWAAILRRYLPSKPPSDLTFQFGSDPAPLIRAYTLEAALRGHKLALIDISPPNIRDELKEQNRYSRSQEAETFQREVGGLFPWMLLSAEITCGHTPADLAGAVESAVKETSSAEARGYHQHNSLQQGVAREWLNILRDASVSSGPAFDTFRSWLAKRKNPFWPDTLISLCRSSARANGFESLAMDFASQTYEDLEPSRENAESRADYYQRLARAILVVSPSEANIYFNRAVEIGSRIGDENLDRWGAFLHLASAAGQRNVPRPQTAYRLSRVAELTYEYVDRDKYFDWEGTADALTDLCSGSALTILSRWRDRRFGNPGRLLPLVVYRLIEQGRLLAFSPIVFAGVVAEWKRPADLKRVVAAETDLTRRSLLAQIGYRYIRVQPFGSDTWLALKDLSETYNLDFRDIDRLIAAAQERESARNEKEQFPIRGTSQPKREPRTPDWNLIFQDIDLGDSGALREAYAAVCQYDPPYEFEAFYREAFDRVKVGREPELIHAFAAWPDFGVFELHYLLDTFDLPRLNTVSIRSAIKDAVLSVCRREPGRIYRRGWRIPFEELDSEGIVPGEDVVRATLDGFAEQADTLSADALFQLIDPISACLSPEEADEALNYGMDLLESTLRTEDGDGPWRAEFQPPQDLTAALAGYVWAGLGSPVVAERWEYAHVVRTAAELDWTEFLEALGNWANTGVGGPNVDQGLVFYVWDARQWLLIGLARGAIENARALRPAVPLVRHWLEERHVLIRELAAQTLRTLVTAGELGEDEVSDLNAVNRSNLTEKVYSGWLDAEEEEPDFDEKPDGDDEYYFGIDIGPYWFAPLGRAFGLSQKAVELRARKALLQHTEWAGGGWQEDERYQRKIFGDNETSHSHGSLPRAEDLRAYHGYHAMMLSAADILDDRPVRRNAEETINKFQEWLSRYLLTRVDGKWLADRRDPRLVPEPPPPEGYGDKIWRWGVTATYLDQQLVTEDGLTALSGYWDGGEHGYNESISVRSALVSRTGAEALLAALQTAADPDRFYLPSAGERGQLATRDLELEGWVADENISARLDEQDPWAEALHYPGPAPSQHVIQKLNMTESEDKRTWTAGSDCLLRSETWTHTRGYGREQETVSGYRLSGNLSFVKRLLDALPEYQLILRVAVRRRPSRHWTDKEEFDSYTPPYVRYYLMENDGVAHTL